MILYRYNTFCSDGVRYAAQRDVVIPLDKILGVRIQTVDFYPSGAVDIHAVVQIDAHMRNPVRSGPDEQKVAFAGFFLPVLQADR